MNSSVNPAVNPLKCSSTAEWKVLIKGISVSGRTGGLQEHGAGLSDPLGPSQLQIPSFHFLPGFWPTLNASDGAGAPRTHPAAFSLPLFASPAGRSSLSLAGSSSCWGTTSREFSGHPQHPAGGWNTWGAVGDLRGTANPHQGFSEQPALPLSTPLPLPFHCATPAAPTAS